VKCAKTISRTLTVDVSTSFSVFVDWRLDSICLRCCDTLDAGVSDALDVNVREELLMGALECSHI
jgi:hypothetical protein